MIVALGIEREVNTAHSSDDGCHRQPYLVSIFHRCLNQAIEALPRARPRCGSFGRRLNGRRAKSIGMMVIESIPIHPRERSRA